MALRWVLERQAPDELPARRSTVVFLAGACADPEREIVALEIAVDGARHRVSAFNMPRPDLRAPHGLELGFEHIRSGFWATVPVPAAPSSSDHTNRQITLELVAQFKDGSAERAELGRITVFEPEPRAEAPARPASHEEPLITVCMATYEPDPRLLATQIESLRRQRDQSWICVISDDGSGDERFEAMRRLIGDDPRFAIDRSSQRLGFYRNFERALEMVPPSAALVALSDQDDRWHPDKLSTLRGQIGDATLIYSDLRLVDGDGRLLRSTLWEGRSNNHEDLVSMLVANTITGAAMLFRRELLEVALPFPDTPGFQFHDTWLAVIGLTAGQVAYVERPLYDYVQHPGAVFGDVTHGRRPRHGLDLARSRAWLRARWRAEGSRAAYFHGYLGRAAQAQVALARCEALVSPPKLAALRRFVAADRSPTATVWLALRSTRALRGHSETLGSELALARGVLWKGLTFWAIHHPWLMVGPMADASVPGPEAFSQRRLRRWRARL